MAGSISLSLSQQFDRQTGKMLSGGKLKFIQAGTTDTPQNAYYDTALTLPLPNPVTLDAGGNVPAFYLADGQIKIRLTSSTGVVQIEQDNLLVIGPSSGGGGGGGVDPTTVFQTGDCLWLDVTGDRTGWVRDNGRTIGSATSGATERANSDTSALWIWLYGKYPNSVCPVSGGRTGNAANDYAANKTITLPDKRGYVAGGLDDMGNTAASRYSNVPVVSGDTITAGSVLGEATHALIAAENGPHSHGGNTGAGTPHKHGIHIDSGTNAVAGTGIIPLSNFNTALEGKALSIGSTDNESIHTHPIASDGSGTAHNTVQKTVLGTFYRKL